MEYAPFSWQEAEKAVYSISQKIDESGFRPDILVGISRGGLVPSRLLPDVLNVPILYTIRISFYSSVGVRMEEPKVTQPLSVDVSGKSILMIDDISDSGKSLELAEKYLKQSSPPSLKTATFHFKPDSCFRPDYFYAETSSWIVYPWEREEFERQTGRRADEL